MRELIVFLVAALTLDLTPGNDRMFVAGQSVRAGFRACAMARLGIAIGSFVHLLLVALGVAIILDRRPFLFDVIRMPGTAYLIWQSWQSLRAPQTAEIGGTSQRTALAAWRNGVLVNLFNPKVIVFVFAFLPPFIRPEGGNPLLQLFVLGTTFNAGGTVINLIAAGAAGRIAGRISASQAATRWLRRLSAVIFVRLAARLVLDRR